jgi:hypothetical protein
MDALLEHLFGKNRALAAKNGNLADILADPLDSAGTRAKALTDLEEEDKKKNTPKDPSFSDQWQTLQAIAGDVGSLASGKSSIAEFAATALKAMFI